MSIGNFFLRPSSQRRLRVGPLASELDGFAAWLATQGYARQTASGKLRLARCLSLRLESEGLGIEALDEERFERFLRIRGTGRAPQGEAATGRQLLSRLRREGRIPEAPEDAGSDDAVTRVERTYIPGSSGR